MARKRHTARLALALALLLALVVTTGCKSRSGATKKGGDADSAREAMMKATGGQGTAAAPGEKAK